MRGILEPKWCLPRCYVCRWVIANLETQRVYRDARKEVWHYSDALIFRIEHGAVITGFSWHPKENRVVMADCMGDIHYSPELFISTESDAAANSSAAPDPIQKVDQERLVVSSEKSNKVLESQLFDVEASEDPENMMMDEDDFASMKDEMMSMPDEAAVPATDGI